MTLRVCVSSFQVDSIAQATAIATINTIAPPQPSGAELLQEAGLRRHQPGERDAQREARDRHPELHLPLTGAPERAGAAAARERHADAEGEAPGQRAEPRGGKHPFALVLEVGELQDREAERRDDERQRGGPRVLGVSGHERLAKGSYQTEARALEDHAERGAEEQE